MDKLGKSAYDTAQKYGVSATEYLKSVGMFSKSDYKGAADQLGELALRTQVAGDMSAEAASDFLLAGENNKNAGATIVFINVPAMMGCAV